MNGCAFDFVTVSTASNSCPVLELYHDAERIVGGYLHSGDRVPSSTWIKFDVVLRMLRHNSYHWIALAECPRVPVNNEISGQIKSVECNVGKLAWEGAA